MFLFPRGKVSLSPGFLQYARKFFSFVKSFLSFLLLYSFQRTVPRLVCRVGGDEENRTPDPLLARQVLSQLSYTPVFRVKIVELRVKIHSLFAVLHPFSAGLRNFIFSFPRLKVHNLSIAPSKLNNDLQVLILIDHRI